MTKPKLADALLENGKLEPIGTVAQRCLGTRPSRPTIWRWTKKGVTGGIRLRAVFCDGWRTTEAAFRDFLEKRTEAMLLDNEPVPDVSDDELRANGLL